MELVIMENKKRHRFVEQFFQIFRKKTTTVLNLDSKSKTTCKQRSVKRNSSLTLAQRKSNACLHPALGSSVLKDLQKFDNSSTKAQASEVNSHTMLQQLAKCDTKITALESSPQRNRHSSFFLSETNTETGKMCKEENIGQYSFTDQGLAGQDCVKPGKYKLCRSQFDVRNKGGPVWSNNRSTVATVKALGKVTEARADISQNPSHDSGFDQNTCVANDLKLETGLRCFNEGYREFNVSSRNTLSQKFAYSKSPWSQSSLSSFEEDEDDDFHIKRIVRRTRSQRDLRHRRFSNVPTGTVDGLPYMCRRRMNSSDETVTYHGRSQSEEVLEQWKLRGKLCESLPGVASEMHSAVRRRKSLPRFVGKIDDCSARNRNSMYTGSAVGTIADKSVSRSLARRAKSTNHLDRRRCPASSSRPPPYPLHCRGSFQSPYLNRDAYSPNAICHFSALQDPCFNGMMDISDQPAMEVAPIELLRQAANCGHLARVHELLSEGATLDKDQDGCTVLHYAAAGGHPEVVELLLKQGCLVDAKDKVGYTALHLAASRGHVNVVRVLLTVSAKIDRQDNQGNTALHEAAWNGYSQTIQLLVMHKANINAVNKTGCTPLHMAAQTGHNQSARVLLFGGCNPNLKNNFGDAALHTAARYGHAGVTMILVSARAKVNQQNKNGDTALHIAAAQKRRKIARILVDAGVNCSIKNKQGEKAEDVATRKQFTDILEVISTKAVKKKRQSIGPSTQGLSPDSGTSAPPTEKKRSKLLTFFSRKNNNDASSDGRKLQQQKSLDMGSKATFGLGSPEDLLDQFYLHQVQTKKQSQEPLGFGSSYKPNRNREVIRGNRIPEDFSPDQQQGERNLGSSKVKQGSRRGGGGREGRLQQCASTDTFTFDGRNPKLEVFQGSERELYVDSRFNVYYIPKGAEFLDGCVYRSRSDDTLSLGSAHRKGMPIADDDDDFYDDYKYTTLKNKKETRAKGSVNNSTQSVTHRAQIEPRQQARNDLCVDETKESRSFLNENGTFLDKNGAISNENGYFPKENGSFPKESGSFSRGSGSFLTSVQPPFATKPVFTASEGYLDSAERDSRYLDEAQDEEFRNPPVLRRGGYSFEDVQQFQETMKSPESSAEQDRPESLSFYDVEHVPSSKTPVRNNQMWNVMKSRQPLSLYLTCTYDGLDPMSNTTSV